MSKKDASFRRRLHLSKTVTAGKTGNTETLDCSPVTASEFCIADVGFSENVCWPLDPLASELLETPCSATATPSTRGSFQTPINDLADNGILATSCLDPSVWEDSGFGTLELDESQDSSADHDGSFQELLLHSASRSEETPNPTGSKGRSRLEQRHRLSTLRDEDPQSEEVALADDSSPNCCKPQFGIRKASVGGEDDYRHLEKNAHGTTTRVPADLSLTPALQLVHELCQRSARMLPGREGLEELLRASEGTHSLKMTMSLAGLIGRKMGLERLDIMFELKRRNLKHILTMILILLSSEDVYRFGQVSDVWDEIIVEDKRASQRRRSFLKEQKIAFELGTAACVPDAETRLNLPCRTALASVQAQSKTPRCHTPLSGNSSFTPVRDSVKQSASKREEFLQVAKTIFSDECLRPCPRCQHPARCHSIKREGVCTWGDCAFQFCTGCLCAYHGSRECVGWPSKRYGKDVLPGSTQSKHNLRRL
ncbi:hypothetical protein AAFF_G00044260 [Aldrovandia affinis]|uniref:ZBR-type domain-containing protein n=1 Tax=Aldrovandia affinis TaxID=143900 RepID=A0AAD7S2E8_9TELE|nr:hypothetical protein AAFF_G00044260 [Aldrovandia affinis]